MKYYSKLILFISILVSTQAYALNSVDLTIVNLRAYTQGTYFVQVNSSIMVDGSSCSTVYKVNPDMAGGSNVIATLLTAFASGKNIIVEIPSTGCTGWGTLIQSLYIK